MHHPYYEWHSCRSLCELLEEADSLWVNAVSFSSQKCGKNGVLDAASESIRELLAIRTDAATAVRHASARNTDVRVPRVVSLCCSRPRPRLTLNPVGTPLGRSTEAPVWRSGLAHDIRVAVQGTPSQHPSAQAICPSIHNRSSGPPLEFAMNRTHKNLFNSGTSPRRHRYESKRFARRCEAGCCRRSPLRPRSSRQGFRMALSPSPSVQRFVSRVNPPFAPRSLRTSSVDGGAAPRFALGSGQMISVPFIRAATLLLI